jgi:hypothetical protein
MLRMAQTAYFHTHVLPSRCPNTRELRQLSEQLDTSSGTFLFAHARLAWLESHGEKELP